MSPSCPLVELPAGRRSHNAQYKHRRLMKEGEHSRFVPGTGFSFKKEHTDEVDPGQTFTVLNLRSWPPCVPVQRRLRD